MPTKVLVLESDRSARRALTSALQSEGFVVSSSETVTGAARLLASEQPDIVLLDVDLGVGQPSGLELASMMSGDKGWAKIPLIITSAMDIDEIRRRAQKNALEGLRTMALEKPLDIGKLVARIRLMTHTEPPP